MVIFSTNKKNTEKYGKKNCLQVDDDGIKYVCGDIYVKKKCFQKIHDTRDDSNIYFKAVLLASFKVTTLRNQSPLKPLTRSSCAFLCLFLPSPINPCFCRALHGDV